MALDTAKKAQIVAKFARKSGDTGSSEVQIALLTTRISELTEHLKVNKKDLCIKIEMDKEKTRSIKISRSPQKATKIPKSYQI